MRASDNFSIVLLAADAQFQVLARQRLLRDLMARGHRLAVIAPDANAVLAPVMGDTSLQLENIELQRSGLSPSADLIFLNRLTAILARMRPDLLMTFTIKPNVWGGLAAKRLSIPSIGFYTGLGYAFTPQPGFRNKLTSKIVRRLVRTAIHANDVIVLQNKDDLKTLYATGCLKDRSKVVMTAGSGVDLEKFAPVPLPNAPSFLMIARLLKAKGVAEYAEAALRVQSRHPHARFALAGPIDTGPDRIDPGALEAWRAGGLIYLGEISDPAATIAEARIGVLPSYREGTPRVNLEMMAMGRPLVTSDTPGCRETVRHGVNGLLVEPRSVDAVETAMERMIADPEGASRMGAASLQLARERFAVELVNRRLLDDLGL